MIEKKEKTIQNNDEVNIKVIENQNISITIEKKIFTILKDGIFAFSAVLLLLTFFKLLALSTESISNFVVTVNDIVYSSWALIIVTSIEIISYKKS